MPTLAEVVLYVKSPCKSADFYQHFLTATKREDVENFSCLTLTNNLLLAFQQKDNSEPPAQPTCGGFELVLHLDSKQAVDEMYAKFNGKTVIFDLQPTQLIFGYTFVVQDIDGHRIRFLYPNQK